MSAINTTVNNIINNNDYILYYNENNLNELFVYGHYDIEDHQQLIKITTANLKEHFAHVPTDYIVKENIWAAWQWINDEYQRFVIEENKPYSFPVTKIISKKINEQEQK